MPEADPASFEWLREAIVQLPPAAEEAGRNLTFADATRTVAVAKDHEGRVEIFLIGPELQATLKPVANSLQFQEWTTTSNDALPANRLVLPNDSHFSAAAAFICIELAAAGYSEHPQRTFSLVEPLVAMFLRRVELGDRVLLGLVGELSLLDALTRRPGSHRVDELVDAWAGFAPSSRDFQLHRTGVEVKATTGASSVHHMQGFHQIELGHSVNGAPEERLYLLSLGFAHVPDATQGGVSLPDLARSITERITSEGVSDAFLRRIQQYGGDTAIGYDHERDQDLPRFKRRFAPIFERLYDLADERLKILRRVDVEPHTNVNAESVAFRVDLPRQVNGELNPIAGMRAAVATLLDLP